MLDEAEADFEFRPSAKSIDVTTRWDEVERIYVTLQRVLHPEAEHEGDGGEVPNVEESYMVKASKTLSTLFVHPRVVEKTKNGMDLMVHLFETCQLLLEYFQQANQKNSDDADRFFADVERYEREVRALREELLKLQSVTTNQESDGRRKDDQNEILELRQVIEERNEQLMMMESENEELSVQLAQLKIEFRKLSSQQRMDPKSEDDQEQELLKINKKLEAKLKTLEQMYEEVKEESNNNQQLLRKRDAEMLALNSKLSRYEEGVDGLAEALKEIRYLREQLELRNIEILDYKSREQEWRRKLNELLDVIEVLQQMGINVNIDITSYRKARDSKLLQELEELRQQNSDLLKQIADLKKEMSSIDNYKIQIRDLKERIASLESSNKTMQLKIDELREEIQRLTALVHDGRSQNTNAADSAEIERLRNEIRLKEDLITKMNEELLKLREQLNATQSQGNSADSAELERLRNEIIRLKQELEQKRGEIERSRIEQQEEIRRLTALLNDAQSQNNKTSSINIEELRLEIARLYEELVWTRNELEQKGEEIGHSRLELGLKNQTIKKLEVRIIDADRMRDELLKRLAEDTGQEFEWKRFVPLHDKDVNVDDLEEEIKVLHVQIADMMEREAILQKKVLNRDEEIRHLKERSESIQELQAELSSKDSQIAELRLFLNKSPTKERPDIAKESQVPEAVRNVIQTFEELIRQKDATISRYESQLGELRDEMTKQKTQFNEEILALAKRLQSKESMAVLDFRAIVEKIENSSPEDVDPSGIPVSQVDEMFAEKRKEIEEQIKIRKQLEGELSRKEQQLLEKQQQIESLTAQYEQDIQSYLKTMNELERRLKEQREHYEEEMANLVEEKLSLSQSLRQKSTPKSEHKKCEQQLSDLRNQKAQLEETVRKLTENLMKSESALAVRQKRDASEFEARVNKIVENRMEKITQELNRVKEENEQLRGKKVPDREHELKVQLDEMKKELDAKQRILEKQFATVKRLNNNKELLLRELDAYRLNSNGFTIKANARIEELEKRNKILEMSNNTFTRRENERLMKELSEERMKFNELKRQFTEMQNTAQQPTPERTPKQHYNNLQKDIQRLDIDLQNQLEKTKNLSSVNSKQSEEIAKLQAEIRVLNDTIAKLKTQKPPPPDPGLSAQQIAKYTENESKLRKRIESINKENESKRKELEDVIESLKKVAENLQKEKAQILKQSVSNVKFMELVKEKRTLQKKLESLEQDIQSKASTKDDVESKFSRVQSDHQHAIDLNKKLSGELERQEKRINELSDEKAQLLKKLDFLTMEMQELRTSTTLKTEESAHVAKLLKEAKRYKDEIKQLREQLHERELDLENLREQFEKVKVKLEKRVELLQSEKDELMHEQRALREEKAKLEEELSELDDGFFEEIENLKYQYFLAKEKLKQYEGKH